MEDYNQFTTADSSKQKSKLETYAPYMIQGSSEPSRHLSYKESNKESRLKPCPFCGHEAVIDDCGDNRYFVRCTHCSINQDKLYKQRCDAVRAWNRRVNDE